MQHVFIIGSRGLPAEYGGFETFVAELVKHQQSSQIKYHVACMSDTRAYEHFDYLGADCFTIKAPQLGPARVIAYDMMAINYALKLIKKEQIARPIFYILGNTIGGFIHHFARKIKAVGGRFFINPDGLEWRRSKWSKPVQMYLKYAEQQMTRYADLVIADNQGIESYIQSKYPWATTTFIAYGTDLRPPQLTAQSEAVQSFYQKWQLAEGDYYLILGRFIPENNYEIAIKEFMATQTKRKLVLITNHEGNPFFQSLVARTQFEKDDRVQFVGTVYDQELLKYIRQNAFAYIHGHEVGGTNPGLLEALSQTDLNLVLNVDFNRRVAEANAHYWDKTPGNLTTLINQLDQETDFEVLGQAAKAHMATNYTWEKIVHDYEELFLK